MVDPDPASTPIIAPIPKQLGDRQGLFTHLVASLIEHAYARGYELTLGEAYRTPEQAALNAKAGTGISASVHCDRLAIDLNPSRMASIRQGLKLTAR